jgi:hypothetical protein
MEDGSENFIPRGIRNNNPGNIKKNNVEWEGLAPENEQIDNTFFVFSSAKYGIRALCKILITYRSYGLNNIFSIIKNLENTIEDYLPIVKGIILMENGVQPYSEDEILEGMYLAWNQ